jgi:hypothetical protein
MFNRSCAYLACAFFALEPLQFAAVNQIATETLAGFLYTIIALISLRLWFSEKFFLRICISLGLIIAIATFIRPATYYFPLFLLPFLFLCFRNRIPFIKLAYGTGLLFLFAYVPLICWQVRNYKEVKSFRFTGIECMSMYYYRAGAVLAHRQGVEFQDKLKELRNTYPYPTRPPVGPEFDRLCDEGLTILLKDPGATLIVHFKGAISMLLGVRNPVIRYFSLPYSSVVIAFLQMFWVIAIAFAMIGFLNAMKKSLRINLLLIALPLYIIVVSCGPEANPRFRTPLMGLIVIYVAQGSALVFGKITNRSQD